MKYIVENRHATAAQIAGLIELDTIYQDCIGEEIEASSEEEAISIAMDCIYEGILNNSDYQPEIGNDEVTAYDLDGNPYDRYYDFRATPVQKQYYILNDLDGYGSDHPVCVDEHEIERLVNAGWGRDSFHEADQDEIDLYGVYDSDN